MNTKWIFKLQLLAIFGGLSLQAGAEDMAEAVTVKEARIYSMQGDDLTILSEKLKFPADIEIETNGNFQISSGKERSLHEGQILRRDGWLLNVDGSIEPVVDHLAMKAGKVIVVRDGETETITKPMSLPNNFQINPDGSCLYPNGKRTRLVDGQLFQLDGTPIPSKDTVILKNGQVMIQKAGSMITLASGKVMGMNDGTRIYGNGSIHNKDGSVTQLHEGKVILIDGAAANH